MFRDEKNTDVGELFVGVFDDLTSIQATMVGMTCQPDKTLTKEDGTPDCEEMYKQFIMSEVPPANPRYTSSLSIEQMGVSHDRVASLSLALILD